MSLPPWPDWTEAEWRIAARRKTAKDTFDESKHPRNPEGTKEGGQFTESGHSGVPTSDPLLAVQAKAGIAAVEKLLPAAIRTADWSTVEGGWEHLKEDAQEKVREEFLSRENKAYKDTYRTFDFSDLNYEVTREIAKGQNKELEAARETLLESYPQLDPDTVGMDQNPDWLGNVQLEWRDIRLKDGSAPSPMMMGELHRVWVNARTDDIEAAVEAYQKTDAYKVRRDEAVQEALRNEWKAMDAEAKLKLALDMRLKGQLPGDVMDDIATEPKHWVSGVSEGTHEDEDYARTAAVAKRLTLLRTDEIIAERGLNQTRPRPDWTIKASNGVDYNFVVLDAEGQVVGRTNTHEEAKQRAQEWQDEEAQKPLVRTEDLIHDVWQQWVRKSSEGISVSLQLAAARELGGLHRLTPEEVAKAEADAIPYGGMATMQAYVRAQWEVNQLVFQKAGETKVSIYRGLKMPGEKIDAVTNISVNTSDKGPIPPPTNISVEQDKDNNGDVTNEWVRFEYDGRPFESRSRRIPEPQLWSDVPEAVKKQVHEIWAKSVQEVHEAEGHPVEVGMQLYDKMSAASKFRMLQDYRRYGHLPYPDAEFESTEQTIQRRIREYHMYESQSVFTQLPDLQLQRAGAASTTGTLSVANEWGGIPPLPPDPTRVVLRIETPPTSILSLPIYGANTIGEHEVVVLGTKDKWLWDAWRDKAPSLDNYTITGEPVKKPLKVKSKITEEKLYIEDPVDVEKRDTTLVIDLQAEDRGKPHWMSTVDWSKVEPKS